MKDKTILQTRGVAALKFKKQNALPKSTKLWWRPEKTDQPENQKTTISQEALMLSKQIQSQVSWQESLAQKFKTQDLCQGLRWWQNQKKLKLTNQVVRRLSQEASKKKQRNQGLRLSRAARQKDKLRQNLNNQNRILSVVSEAMPAERLSKNRKQDLPMLASKGAKIPAKNDNNY